MNPKTIKPLTLLSLPLADRSQLPACPAVYFVLDGDNDSVNAGVEIKGRSHFTQKCDRPQRLFFPVTS
ncbi:hypothetical protein [Microcoleus sp. herbarium14]|uniref:hypothetical protein n=1 Tax=Microcoleus sp. herbarium14 TaxID=3055439 RepID=UPI002FD026CA